MKRRTKLLIRTATKLTVKAASGAAKKYASGAAKDFLSDVMSEYSRMHEEEETKRRIQADRQQYDRPQDRSQAGEQHYSTPSVVMRTMLESDRAAVLGLMREFYSSDAVLTDGSDEIFNNDITECVSASPFAEGFVFTDTCPADDPEDMPSGSEAAETQYPADHICGYAMIVHSFSTEYGRHCIWIEDLYLSEEVRGRGIGSQFLNYLAETYPEALHRLEAENENVQAMEVYKHSGFREMPYVELYRKKQ